MNKNQKRILVAIFFIILIIFARSLGIERYINFETLKESREYIYNFAQQHYLLSVFSYIFIYIIICTLTLPLALLLTLIGGFLFGVVACVIYTNIGATIGATITFIIFRYILGDLIQKKYKKALTNLNRNIDEYGTIYLLLMRLIAIPFFVENILIALTNVPIKTFIWTTSLGIIPGTIIYAFAGKHLANINSIKEIFSPKIIFSFALLIVFAIFTFFIQRYRKINLKNNNNIQK